MRTREEHVEWSKRRALKYLPGEPENAICSLISDMQDFDIKFSPVLVLEGLRRAAAGDAEGVRRFIEGFR